jgi:hypothetical protein
MKIWASEWYLKTYGKPIPVTQEDIEQAEREQEERDWEDEQRHREGLLQGMSLEVKG